MTRIYSLSVVEGAGRVPNTGETLGHMLELAGNARFEAAKDKAQPAWWVEITAQLYYLAADAFDDAAAKSFGHSRTDRYMEQAKELRAKADKLIADARS